MAGGRPAARGRLPPRRREVPLRYSAGAALAPGNGFCPLRGRGIWRQEAAVELSFGCRKSVDRCSCPEKAGGDPEERDSGTRTPLHLPATHTLASRGGAGRAAVPGTRKSRGAQKLLATGGRWCCGCHVGVGRVRVSAGDTEVREKTPRFFPYVPVGSGVHVPVDEAISAHRLCKMFPR
ncbi:uncharacterized protein LOC133625103 isoform X4 [Colius striatus]|uniref:uncharacterized protein LOC133625103 isoform X4 n=1 Tax=Colius striatus TaxID=57412 RepID=UPI002B1E208B|nr:uncharacterized protein LOC133625103 isoform X4 [Colius striatus]